MDDVRGSLRVGVAVRRRDIMSTASLRGVLIIGLAAGAVATLTCGGKVVIRPGGDDDATSVPPPPTTTTWTSTGPTTVTTSTWPTSNTTSTWPTTSTTSTWTTTPYCQADLASSVGATAACSLCVNANCCPEAEQFESMVDQESFDALLSCAVAEDTTGPCSLECMTELCAGELYYPFFQACGECLNANCCTELESCLGSPNCEQCFYSWNEGCCNNELYLGWDACSNSCEQECGGSMCVN
jgi:hypothetical protein